MSPGSGLSVSETATFEPSLQKVEAVAGVGVANGFRKAAIHLNLLLEMKGNTCQKCGLIEAAQSDDYAPAFE